MWGATHRGVGTVSLLGSGDLVLIVVVATSLLIVVAVGLLIVVVEVFIPLVVGLRVVPVRGPYLGGVAGGSRGTYTAGIKVRSVSAFEVGRGRKAHSSASSSLKLG